MYWKEFALNPTAKLIHFSANRNFLLFFFILVHKFKDFDFILIKNLVFILM